MAQLKGTSGVRGGGSSSRYSSAKSDNSLAAQIARDNAAMAARSTKQTTTRPTTTRTDNGGGSAYDYAAAEKALIKARRREAAATLKQGIQNAGADLMNANEGLNVAMNWLEKTFTGEKATKIQKGLGKIKEAIDSSIDGLIRYYGLADEKEKENGGVSNTSDSGLHTNPKPFQNSTKTYTGIYSCDIDVLQCDVIPTIKKAVEDLGSARSKAQAFSRDVEGLENIGNHVGEEIGDEKNAAKEVCELLEEQVFANQKLKQENQNILANILSHNVDLPNFDPNFVNLEGALLKGFVNVGEALFDTALLFGATLANSGTMETGEFVPYEYGTNGISDECWKDVMGFVANDYVESAYRGFYDKTEAGQWLDNNAIDIFKSTGVGTQIAAGLGETAGIAVTTILTGGTGAGAMAVAAGTAGFGKYTEYYWGNARENAKEGEDWATEETRNKGILYGAANGTWEAAQWYVGGKLNNLNMAGAPNWANSFVRVGTDTSFNAIDTPFRSLVDAVISDKTYEEAYEERGGKTAVITDIGVGLIGSLVGEIDKLTPSRMGDIQGEGGKTKFYDNKPETHTRDTYQEGGLDIEELDGIMGGQPRDYDNKPEINIRDTYQEGELDIEELDIEELDGIMGGQPRDYDNKPETNVRDTHQDGELDIEELDEIRGGQPREEKSKAETQLKYMDEETKAKENFRKLDESGRLDELYDKQDEMKIKMRNVLDESASISEEETVELLEKMGLNHEQAKELLGAFLEMKSAKDHAINVWNMAWDDKSGIDFGNTIRRSSNMADRMEQNFEDVHSRCALLMAIKEMDEETKLKVEIPTKDWEDLESRGLSANDVEAIYEMGVADRKDYGKFKMQEYFNKNSELYISDETLKYSFEKIKVFESEEEFIKGYRQKLNTYGADRADEEIKRLAGFHWRDGEIFIREVSSVVDVIHEVVHDLGNVNVKGMNSRGFNEAFTERLARKIAGVDENWHIIEGNYSGNGYEFNVQQLDYIFRGLEALGHTSVDTKCYFRENSPFEFAALVCEIAGDDSFFKELVENMDVADGCGRIKDKDAIRQARTQIVGMVDNLLDKIEQY